MSQHCIVTVLATQQMDPPMIKTLGLRKHHLRLVQHLKPFILILHLIKPSLDRKKNKKQKSFRRYFNALQTTANKVRRTVVW